MPADSNFWFCFDRFRFNSIDRLLVSVDDSRSIRLRPKTCAVFSLLIRHAGSVVTLAEIQDHVWPNVSVQPGVLNASIAEIRKALGDRRVNPRFIETLHGSGFRFLASVEVSRQPWPPRAATATPPSRVREVGFVGRQDILAEIAFLGERSDDGVRLAVLHGPAGIGKTRILSEIAAAARHRGARVLYAQADDASRQPVFWIWSQVVRAFADACSVDALRRALGTAAPDIALIVPSIHDRLPDVMAPQTTEPAISRARFFEGMASFLAAIAREQPLLVVLDDLHRAGADSLALLRSTFTFLRDAPVLFLVSYREGEEVENRAFVDILQRWQNTPGVSSVSLPPLTTAESKQLVEAAAVDVSRPLAEDIVRDAGGNPFFILEILKSLEAPTTARATVTTTYDIPGSILSVVRRRLQSVTEETHRLLTVGAVAGREFDMNIAGTAAGLDREALLGAVTQAIGGSFLVEAWESGPRLRFAHALVRETLLTDLSLALRADWHRRIGEALEEVSRTAGGSAGAPAAPRSHRSTLLTQLAYHFFEAMPVDDASKAILHCLRAAQDAAASLSMDQAYTLAERALKLADSAPAAAPELLPEILETLAEASYWKGALEESEALTARLNAVAVSSGSAVLEAKSAVVLARHYFPFRPRVDGRPVQMLEAAFSKLDRSDAVLRGLVIVRLASALHCERGADQRRAELAIEAIEIGRSIPDTAGRIRVLEGALVALWDPDHLDLRATLVDELEDATRRLGDATRLVVFEGWRALNLMAAGKLREAGAAIDRSQETFARDPNSMARYYSTRFRFLRQMLRGDLPAAEAVARDFATEEAHPDGISGAMGAMFADFALRREKACMDGLEPLIRVADATFPVFPWSTGLPYALIAEGRIDEARDELEKLAKDGFAVLPPRNEPSCWMLTLGLLADACAELDDTARATELYERLAPYAGRWVIVHFAAGIYGSVDRLLGRLAATMGAADRARAHFEDAVATCERESLPIELAWVRLHQAQAGQRHGLCEAEQARLFRQQALDLATRHGLTAVQKAAGQLRFAS